MNCRRSAASPVWCCMSGASTASANRCTAKHAHICERRACVQTCARAQPALWADWTSTSKWRSPVLTNEWTGAKTQKRKEICSFSLSTSVSLQDVRLCLTRTNLFVGYRQYSESALLDFSQNGYIYCVFVPRRPGWGSGIPLVGAGGKSSSLLHWLQPTSSKTHGSSCKIHTHTH